MLRLMLSPLTMVRSMKEELEVPEGLLESMSRQSGVIAYNS